MMTKLTFTMDSEKPYLEMEHTENGVTAVKPVAVSDFCSLLAKNIHLGGFQTGVLPPGCISLSADQSSVTVFLLCGFCRCDITYHDMVCWDFPLPRLVIGAKMDRAGRLHSFRLGVIENTLPTPDTQMYRYPFSNVGPDGSLCVGANVFRGYDSMWKLRTLPYRLLSIPNNDDRYSAKNSRLDLPYRELLEHLKDKDTKYYYEKVLIPSGMQLKDFIER